MTKRPSPSAPQESVDAYDRLVASVPGAERKGASMPYTAVNGNMFSYLDASGSMALRLDAADRASFIERYATALHVAHGTVQKEYVTVPDSLLDDPDQLRPWFEASMGYASGLRPKPTTRGAAPG